MTEQLQNIEAKWSTLKKVSFLFMLFYTLIFVLISIPDALIFWTGKNILGIQDLQMFPDNGGGDTTFDYVTRFVQISICLILCMIVFTIDRKRDNYIKLQYWLFLVIRYQLAFFMLEYGFAKVFKTQFPYPNLARLTEPYGDSSPMGLLWTFMGYSTGFNIFIGAAEMIGGFLLLFRRTITLGSIITLVVMFNVALLNMFYDVAVKIFSIELVLFSIVLLSPDIKKLYQFFILKKEVSLTNFYSPTLPKWMNISRILIKTVVISYAMIYGVFHYYEEMMESSDRASKPPLYGVYKTELFIINKDTLSPFVTDSTRWEELIIDKRRGRIKSTNEKLTSITLKVDTLQKSIAIKLRNDTSKTYNFVYADSQNYLNLKGNWNKDSLTIKFKKIPVDKFLLVNRGFHWINEFPLNK